MKSLNVCMMAATCAVLAGVVLPASLRTPPDISSAADSLANPAVSRRDMAGIRGGAARLDGSGPAARVVNQQAGIDSLRAADAPADAVWLDTIDLTRAPIRRPRAGRGQPAPPPLTFSLGGQTYAHALPQLVDTDIVIDLHRQARRFAAMVDVDDVRRDGQGSASFEVWVEGRKTADSGLLKSGGAPARIDVDLKGAHRMTLSVGDAGDSPRDDIVEWGGAIVMLDDAAAPRPAIVDPPAAPVPSIASSVTAMPSIAEPRMTGANSRT